MKVIVKAPNQKAEVKEIDGSLESMQGIVGGYIQTLPLENYLIICNEEGKLQELQPNFHMGYDTIVGSVFITKASEEDFVSLTDEDIQIISKISPVFSVIV